jgi:hypothetical protein
LSRCICAPSHHQYYDAKDQNPCDFGHKKNRAPHANPKGIHVLPHPSNVPQFIIKGLRVVALGQKSLASFSGK